MSVVCVCAGHVLCDVVCLCACVVCVGVGILCCVVCNGGESRVECNNICDVCEAILMCGCRYTSTFAQLLCLFEHTG